MKRDFFLLAALFCFCLQAPRAQYAVYPASARLAKPAENALFYCLPRNSYRIVVEVEETILERGIYADYAEKLLKLPAIKENSVSYRIKDIKIRTSAHPDPLQVFSLQGTNLPALRLTPDGILLEVNPSERMPPASRPERKSAGTEHRPVKAVSEIPDLPASGALPVADLNIRQKFDTTVRRHVSDTMTVIEKILRPVVDEKSLAEQARKMADLILKLQESKTELLSGLQEVPYPAGTMEFMYRQMERNERRYLDCFTGTMRKECSVHTFTVTPDDNVYDYPVAFFSPETGIEDIPAEVREKIRHSEEVPDVLLLRLSPLPFAGEQAARFSENNTAKEKDGGFYYRLPRKAVAGILLEGETLAGREVFVSQWGEVLQLPVRERYSIRLDGKSGGLEFFGPIQTQQTATRR